MLRLQIQASRAYAWGAFIPNGVTNEVAGPLSQGAVMSLRQAQFSPTSINLTDLCAYDVSTANSAGGTCCLPALHIIPLDVLPKDAGEGLACKFKRHHSIRTWAQLNQDLFVSTIKWFCRQGHATTIHGRQVCTTGKSRQFPGPHRYKHVRLEK
jgi:hypothetical protein